MTHDPVNEIRKRNERYWFEDGFWEIAYGLVNVFLGGFFYLSSRFERQDTSSALIFLLLQTFVLVVAFLSVGYLVRFLKERITYPRTGYVQYKKPATSQRVRRMGLSAALAALMAAVMGVFIQVSKQHQIQNTVPLVASILLCGALVYLGKRFDLAKLYLVGILTVLMGFVFALLPIDENQSQSLFFAGFGVILILSGLISLVVYLRQNQPPSGDMPAEVLMDEQGRDE